MKVMKVNPPSAEVKHFHRSLVSGRSRQVRKCPHSFICLYANSPEAIGFGLLSSGKQPKEYILTIR